MTYTAKEIYAIADSNGWTMLPSGVCKLGDNVKLGYNVKLWNNVELGDSVKLGDNVKLGYVKLGKGRRVKGMRIDKLVMHSDDIRETERYSLSPDYEVSDVLAKRQVDVQGALDMQYSLKQWKENL